MTSGSVLPPLLHAPSHAHAHSASHAMMHAHAHTTSAQVNVSMRARDPQNTAQDSLARLRQRQLDGYSRPVTPGTRYGGLADSSGRGHLMGKAAARDSHYRSISSTATGAGSRNSDRFSQRGHRMYETTPSTRVPSAERIHRSDPVRSTGIGACGSISAGLASSLPCSSASSSQSGRCMHAALQGTSASERSLRAADTACSACAMETRTDETRRSPLSPDTHRRDVTDTHRAASNARLSSSLREAPSLNNSDASGRTPLFPAATTAPPRTPTRTPPRTPAAQSPSAARSSNDGSSRFQLPPHCARHDAGPDTSVCTAESAQEAACAAKKPRCDKCDGAHATDGCPWFKKGRDNHPDAVHGKRQLGQSSGPVEVLSHARVVRQPGDGSCLFHSLSHGLSDGSTAHSLRRQASRPAEIATFLENNPDLKISDAPLKEWVLWDSGSSVAAYCRRILSPSTWGGGIEMAALSHMKKVNVHVYQSSPRIGGTGYKRISCFEGPPGCDRVVRVIYQGGVHYDALEKS